MGMVQKDAFRTMILSYVGMVVGYVNKAVLFLLILTTEQIGLVNLIASVGTLFAQVANLGTVFTTIRFFPFFKNKEKKHHGFLPLMMILATLGSAICVFLALLFRDEIEQLYIGKSPEFVHYYFWIIPIGVGYVFFLLLDAYLRSFFKNIIPVFAFDIVLRLGVFVLLLVLWFEWIDFDTFVVVNSLLYFLPTLILTFYLYNMGELYLSPKKINISKRFRKIIFSFSSFNYLNTLGAIVIVSLDVTMVAKFLGLTATGVYSTIMLVVSATQIPYKSLIRIGMPIVAEAWKEKDMKKMEDIYKKTSSVMLTYGVFIFLFLWLNIEFVFSFVPEDKQAQFNAGIWVFFYLMIGRLLDMYFSLNGTIFGLSKKYKFDLIFTFFLVFAVFFLNLLLIPKWGIVGAAISTMTSVVLYNFGRLIFVQKAFKINPFTKGQMGVLALGVLTFGIGVVVNSFLPSGWVSFFVNTFMIGLVFIAPIYIFKLDSETVNFVNNGSRFLLEKIFTRKKTK